MTLVEGATDHMVMGMPGMATSASPRSSATPRAMTTLLCSTRMSAPGATDPGCLPRTVVRMTAQRGETGAVGPGYMAPSTARRSESAPAWLAGLGSRGRRTTSRRGR
jgi:hypothetical protein